MDDKDDHLLDALHYWLKSVYQKSFKQLPPGKVEAWREGDFERPVSGKTTVITGLVQSDGAEKVYDAHPYVKLTAFAELTDGRAALLWVSEREVNFN